MQEKDSSVSLKTKRESEVKSTEVSIWTERMKSALANGVKGGKWYSLINKVYEVNTLEISSEEVLRNRGSSGVDGVTVEIFRRNKARYLDEIEKSLREGNYKPSAIRRVEIPKGDGKTRPLGIPTVKDRIVQMAVKKVIEPIFEAEFLDMSYGFRPGRGCKDALREVDKLIKAGNTWVVDVDLKSFFDSIPHESLLVEVKRRITDGRIIGLIEGWLKQDVLKGMETWKPTQGTPQGGVISPLLANIYLHPLDVRMKELGYKMVRYADDVVVLCENEESASQALKDVERWVEGNGLSLNTEKTQKGNCSEEGKGISFLGYVFECGKRYVRSKSLKAVRRKVKEKTPRKSGKSLQSVIATINPILKGWYEYFKHAHRNTFQAMDDYVRRRLRAMLRRHEKKNRGFGANLNDHTKWKNSFFAKHGLFTMKEARA